MRLQRLARRRRHRHRDLESAGVREAEVEVLAQQRRRERRGPVQIDQGRRLVPREDRAHHALVDEVQKGVPRHAGLLRQDGDLGEILDDHAQHDVVRDLADPRELALADIGHAPAGNRRKKGLDFAIGRLRPGSDRAELARLDALAVAADRRCDQHGTPRAQPLPERRRFLDPDRRAVDEELRHHTVAAGGHALLAEIDLLEVLAG
jgi:hypothetical protein